MSGGTAILAVLVGVLGWHYVGYPLVLWAVSSRCGTEPASADLLPDDDLPPVSIVIPAHNEADGIEARLENLFASDYPTEKLEIIVASDASTDGTVAIAESVSPRVTAFNNTPQNKSATRNRGVERASSDIVLFTDVDTRNRPDCLRRLVTPLTDPDVGAVCGTLVSESFDDGAIGTGMSLYWQWEYFMRRHQSRLGMLVKSSGAVMGIDQAYFEPIPDTADIDQTAGFMTILRGGKSLYVPKAVATEQFPTTLSGEFSTRRRLTIRGLTALWRYRTVFNPLMRPLLTLHTVSYWLLRYLIPVALLAIAVLTGLLAPSSPLIAAFGGLQVVFYLLAGVGYAAEHYGLNPPLTSVPFSYSWASLGVLAGLVAFATGTRVYAYDL
ncbi:glycosyltransferase [Haloarcula sp. JP-L23]|uniref:glycosyltransferase n=1 Tax=Haloarcula sp. JP-L23 TaxID=2716717 RepID=UPI00140F4BD4|nr:glycosyltransferase [Haloarcula sp. JP-L23]